MIVRTWRGQFSASLCLPKPYRKQIWSRAESRNLGFIFSWGFWPWMLVRLSSASEVLLAKGHHNLPWQAEQAVLPALHCCAEDVLKYTHVHYSSSSVKTQLLLLNSAGMPLYLALVDQSFFRERLLQQILFWSSACVIRHILAKCWACILKKSIFKRCVQLHQPWYTRDCEISVTKNIGLQRCTSQPFDAFRQAFEAVHSKLKFAELKLPAIVPLHQEFPACGTRTTSGTRRSSRWYAGNFHFLQKPGFAAFEFTYRASFQNK